MKITDVEAIHLRLPEVAEIADGTQDVLVVKVHTDMGLTGIGEVTSQSYVCKAIVEAPRSAERRHGLAHILRGQDPLDVEGLWQRMYYHTNRPVMGCSDRARARLLEPYKVAWLDEALSQDDLAGYAELCSEAPVPIAAGEGGVTHWDFVDLVRCGLQVLQPDVAFCGGLTVCCAVSRLAQAAGLRAVPHCFSTGINLAASLHWMASCPEGDLVEYCLRPSPLMRSLVRNLPPLVGGRMAVPQGPGLGIELDEEVVNRYRVGCS